MKSILIINGRVFSQGKVHEKNILIENDRIRAVTDERPTVDTIIDAKGLLILPGIIDLHVHLREPGDTHKEDFLTGSRAAAAGGVTTMFDMPNTRPPTTKEEYLTQKEQLAKKCIINIGHHFCATPNNAEEIRKVNKRIGFVKIYMNETTGNLLFDKDESLKAICEAADRIAVHAEGGSVEKIITLFRSIDSKKKLLYLCHISERAELEVIAKYKRANILAEVTPHHLFLTKDDVKGGFQVMKPPLKSKEDVDALWKGIDSGIITTIGTDHAPHTIEEKKSEHPPYGVPGLETSLPLMLNTVHEKRITLKKAVELMCENPARILKLNKGKVEEGFDADMVFVDMEMTREVRNQELQTKCGWSPFAGLKLKGWPIKTMVGGNIIYDEGKFNDIKGKAVVCNE
ncbi:TPA: amidohydrolase family protein [Candidatus Woesearchaeota archaeon]|nr:amidohydrolase family protein [Candidatus Woesearchaeota archaeon]HII69375.1 amidohydrolase family protein [Candidatus Woesearchaeota archaeon]